MDRLLPTAQKAGATPICIIEFCHRYLCNGDIVYYNLLMKYNCNVVHLPKVFSPDECIKISNLGKSLNAKPALVHSPDMKKGGVDNKTRKSNIAWLANDPENEWIFTRISKAFKDANESAFGFDIDFVEDIQYTSYKRMNFFKPHFDTGTKQSLSRKLTLSVQLSEPSKYIGGSLNVWSIEGVQSAMKGVGDVLIFPTYLRHQVKNIYYGERECLVAWARGQHPFQ